MCMFDDSGDGRMLPETFDEDGNRTGPNCDGCGQCGPTEDDTE